MFKHKDFNRIIDLSASLATTFNKELRWQNVPLEAFQYLTNWEKTGSQKTLRLMVEILKMDYFKSFVNELDVWATVINNEISADLLEDYKALQFSEASWDFSHPKADLSENGSNELVVLTPAEMGFEDQNGASLFQVYNQAISNMGLALCSTKMALSYADSRKYSMLPYLPDRGTYAYFAMILVRGQQDPNETCIFSVDSPEYDGKKKICYRYVNLNDKFETKEKFIFVRPKELSN